MFWLGFVLGLVTVPVGIALFYLTLWYFDRKWSWGPCPHCNHFGGSEGVEEGFQGRYFLSRKIHFYVWARTKKHRQLRGDAWRGKEACNVQNWPWDDRFML